MIRLVALILGLNTTMAIAEIPEVYSRVAAQHQVPALLLYAVCLQEAGRQVNGHFHPWPWTVNIQGQGHYLDSAESALAVVNTALEHTCRVDIGLCQIHWCAHAQSFTAPADALHPHVNLHYAASILRREYEFTLNQGTPSWWLAVGRYHHPSNHSLASAYRQRVYQRWLPLAQVSP